MGTYIVDDGLISRPFLEVCSATALCTGACCPLRSVTRHSRVIPLFRSFRCDLPPQYRLDQGKTSKASITRPNLHSELLDSDQYGLSLSVANRPPHPIPRSNNPKGGKRPCLSNELMPRKVGCHNPNFRLLVMIGGYFPKVFCPWTISIHARCMTVPVVELPPPPPGPNQDQRKWAAIPHALLSCNHRQQGPQRTRCG